MTDEHRAVNAGEQRRAQFAVIDTLAQRAQVGQQQQQAGQHQHRAGDHQRQGHFRQRPGGQLAADELQQERHDAFGILDDDVAGESVGDDDVGFALGNIATFQVADEVERPSLKQLVSVAHQHRAFVFLFTV